MPYNYWQVKYPDGEVNYQISSLGTKLPRSKLDLLDVLDLYLSEIGKEL